jgi:hypothetical protein
MKITKLLHLGLLASSVVLTGCASIVSKSNWPVTFKSNPPGAEITISDEYGNEIHHGTTPATITLPSDSGYFSKAKYYIDVKQAGYQENKGVLVAKINGWYFGNILFGFGSLIGFGIIDPLTGAMWKLPPMDSINLTKLENAPPQSVTAAPPSATNAPTVSVETKSGTNSVPQN